MIHWAYITCKCKNLKVRVVVAKHAGQEQLGGSETTNSRFLSRPSMPAATTRCVQASSRQPLASCSSGDSARAESASHGRSLHTPPPPAAPTAGSAAHLIQRPGGSKPVVDIGDDLWARVIKGGRLLIIKMKHVLLFKPFDDGLHVGGFLVHDAECLAIPSPDNFALPLPSTAWRLVAQALDVRLLRLSAVEIEAAGRARPA